MKGILFKEHLFKEVLIETKTETRRIIKSPNEFDFTCVLDAENFILNLAVPDGYENFTAKPRYKKGETVYLKEPFYDYGNGVIWYAFDMEVEDRKKMQWQNKLFMPERAARYFVEIKDVKIQLLQDMTIEEMKSEGIKGLNEPSIFDGWINTWDKINGKTYPWRSNPPTFAYTLALTAETKQLIKNDLAFSNPV